jgi:DNA mismatch repair protein MSH4
MVENLNDDVSAGRSHSSIRTRRLYAVKSQCNPMLDVARETYKENIHDIMQCKSTCVIKLMTGTDRLKG